MMWMGKVSAIGAQWRLCVLFGALAVMSSGLADRRSCLRSMIVCALLLLIAAFRTLRKMSGGLRLLCGAWGLVAGLLDRALSLAGAWATSGFWSQLVATQCSRSHQSQVSRSRCCTRRSELFTMIRVRNAQHKRVNSI
jgi:hypothetical protein